MEWSMMTRPINEGSWLPYDRSKANGEREVRKALDRGLDAVVVNPTAVLGPHDYKPSQLGGVLLDLYYRRLPGLVDGGFDWVDVRDVVAGALAAGDKGRTGEKYLLSGARRTVVELARTVEEVTGKKPPWLVSPMWLARGVAPFATRWARLTKTRPRFTAESLHALRNHQLVSHDKATRELGYQPRPLKETIAATFDWFKEARVGMSEAEIFRDLVVVRISGCAASDVFGAAADRRALWAAQLAPAGGRRFPRHGGLGAHGGAGLTGVRGILFLGRAALCPGRAGAVRALGDSLCEPRVHFSVSHARRKQAHAAGDPGDGAVLQPAERVRERSLAEPFSRRATACEWLSDPRFYSSGRRCF